MEELDYIAKYEGVISMQLWDFLREKDEIDGIFPDAPDIEGKWEQIGQAYLADGVREFSDYPTVSLGWMMFVGMAVAKMWDADWERYSAEENLYVPLRDARGYDYMDEYICEEVLGLAAEDAKALTGLVGDVAAMVYASLRRENFEPGTPMAFNAYIRSLYQLYRYGAAVELRRLGYRTVALS